MLAKCSFISEKHIEKKRVALATLFKTKDKVLIISHQSIQHQMSNRLLLE